jgi:hypothetical protein
MSEPLPSTPFNHANHANHLNPPVTTHPDGTVTFDAPNGAKISTNLDGSIALDLQRISAIGVANIIEVQTHNIQDVLGMRTHFIKLHTGGEVRFAYNHSGQLVELSFTGLLAKITETANGLALMFSASEVVGQSQVQYEVTVPAGTEPSTFG